MFHDKRQLTPGRVEGKLHVEETNGRRWLCDGGGGGGGVER